MLLIAFWGLYVHDRALSIASISATGIFLSITLLIKSTHLEIDPERKRFLIMASPFGLMFSIAVITDNVWLHAVSRFLILTVLLATFLTFRFKYEIKPSGWKLITFWSILLLSFGLIGVLTSAIRSTAMRLIIATDVLSIALASTNLLIFFRGKLGKIWMLRTIIPMMILAGDLFYTARNDLHLILWLLPLLLMIQAISLE